MIFIFVIAKKTALLYGTIQESTTIEKTITT